MHFMVFATHSELHMFQVPVLLVVLLIVRLLIDFQFYKREDASSIIFQGYMLLVLEQN